VNHLHHIHEVPISTACDALDLPRASYYREVAPKAAAAPPLKGKPPRALSDEERKKVLEVLDSPRFVDVSPYQVYATLLDEGVYLCSVSTMYRILRENGQVRERRDQLRHPTYEVPRLVASAPNQVWSWDITKLPGPAKWKNYYLYVILDLYSRYVVGWMLADRETSQLSKALIEETCEKQGIEASQLLLHADRGAQMTSKTVSQLLVELGVEQSHSRPRVSNDNAFSESQFKTLKSRPEYPRYFSSLETGRQWCRVMMEWYNEEHHHEGLGLMKPSQVHHGMVEELAAARQQTLEAALKAHPERFVKGKVSAPRPPEVVFLNPPLQENTDVKPD